MKHKKSLLSATRKLVEQKTASAHGRSDALEEGIHKVRSRFWTPRDEKVCAGFPYSLPSSLRHKCSDRTASQAQYDPKHRSFSETLFYFTKSSGIPHGMRTGQPSMFRCHFIPQFVVARRFWKMLDRSYRSVEPEYLQKTDNLPRTCVEGSRGC